MRRIDSERNLSLGAETPLLEGICFDNKLFCGVVWRSPKVGAGLLACPTFGLCSD